MRFKITKYVEAKNIKAVSMMEPKAISIELDEPEEPNINTHAIGFQIDPDRFEGESYDPSH
jgi:hypothetical protein